MVERASYWSWVTQETVDDMVQVGPNEWMTWSVAEYLIAEGWMERYEPLDYRATLPREPEHD